MRSRTGSLPRLAVPRDRFVVPARAAPRDLCLARAQLGDQRLHRGPIRAALVGRRLQPAAQDGHRRMIGGWSPPIVR